MSSINTSVIVCAFNEEKCLLNCLLSIRAEIINYSDNTELIIVDNGANEDVSEYLYSIYKKHTNIGLIKFQENQLFPHFRQFN